jgi:uncharacterized membrane protein
MTDERWYWINCTKTPSVHSFKGHIWLGNYLVSIGTTNGWSPLLWMPSLLQSFMQFIPTASTMVCLFLTPELHDSNTPSCLWYGVSATMILSLQSHLFHPSSQGPIKSVIILYTAFKNHKVIYLILHTICYDPKMWIYPHAICFQP